MAIGARAWQGIGWEYAHVAIDDHSRAAYVEVLPDQTGADDGGVSARAPSPGLRAAACGSSGC